MVISSAERLDFAEGLTLASSASNLQISVGGTCWGERDHARWSDRYFSVAGEDGICVGDMSVSLTGSRVQLCAVHDWAIDTSVVEQSCLDRDAGTLLSLWNDQPRANIRPIHHWVEQVGVMAER